ncbi:MAG TPA: tyrosine recombinase [Ktedonobacterales bacterium]|nr:tyrosine recombinase [Ktedonobacterales bacterium]
MEKVIQEYISALAQQRRSSANTLGAYGTDLRQLADFLRRRGVGDWADVTPALVAGFILQLNERQYAATSIARKVAAIKSFFHFLQATGVLATDPANELDTPRVEKFPPTTLSPQDVARLFAAVKLDTPAGLRDDAMLHCLYSTGMRVTELVSCDTAHLDLARGHIRCYGRNHRERILPLTLMAQRSLATYLADGRPTFAQKSEETPALFLNHHGQRLTRQGFWLIMKGYVRTADVGAVTPHTLRHSFALDMLDRGMELRNVQELLGHANISTTQMYSHLSQTRPTDLDAMFTDLSLSGLHELETAGALHETTSAASTLEVALNTVERRDPTLTSPGPRR